MTEINIVSMGDISGGDSVASGGKVLSGVEIKVKGITFHEY